MTATPAACLPASQPCGTAHLPDPPPPLLRRIGARRRCQLRGIPPKLG